MPIFFVCIEFEVEDQVVAVGEDEATEKGARNTPGPNPFKVGECCCQWKDCSMRQKKLGCKPRSCEGQDWGSRDPESTKGEAGAGAQKPRFLR